MQVDPLFLLLLVANLASFLMFGVDKYRAMKGKWRIPERRLFSAAVLAPFGAFIGMRMFRHKVRKAFFSITVPILALIHIVLYIWWGGLIP